MELAHTYFWIINGVFLVLSACIVTYSEDLKKKNIFNSYFKYTFLIGFLGFVMLFFDWNYYCRYNCLLFSFSPFLTLNIIKAIAHFFQKVFKEEPFALDEGSLSNGIWVRNKGDIKKRGYYAIYSVSILMFPTLLIGGCYIMIDRYFC